MEFFDWGMLDTFAGASMAVAYIVELTKTLPYICRIPTQLWSYLVALVTLLLAMTFNYGFSIDAVGLALYNAVLVSLAANGGYDVAQRVKAANAANTATLQEDVVEIEVDDEEDLAE